MYDPVITLHDSTGAVIATNDNWQDDPGAAELTANGLAPTGLAEAATIQTLVVIRAIGPSLASLDVGDPLADPMLTVYDVNGAVLASNNDWQDGVYADDIGSVGLLRPTPLNRPFSICPPVPTPRLSAGWTRAGRGLVEVYDLQ